MTKLGRTLQWAMALVVLTAAPLAQTPQTPATQAPAMTIQQQNDEMLKELRAIRQLLERLTTPQPSAPPQTAKITNLNGYALGRPDAPFTVVEFTDLECPFCRQYAITSFDEIRKNWMDTGRLRYVSRDFPLDFHAHVRPGPYDSGGGRGPCCRRRPALRAVRRGAQVTARHRGEITTP